MYIARWGINIFKCQIKIRKSLSRERSLGLGWTSWRTTSFFRTAMSRFYGIGNDVCCRSTDGRPDVRLNDCEWHLINECRWNSQSWCIRAVNVTCWISLYKKRHLIKFSSELKGNDFENGLLQNSLSRSSEMCLMQCSVWCTRCSFVDNF